jgi:hypothetical protein
LFLALLSVRDYRAASSWFGSVVNTGYSGTTDSLIGDIARCITCTCPCALARRYPAWYVPETSVTGIWPLLFAADGHVLCCIEQAVLSLLVSHIVGHASGIKRSFVLFFGLCNFCLLHLLCFLAVDLALIATAG